MNSYDLSRHFWDWAFENPDKVKPIHSAIFFFAIEHCNRLGWKEKFGLPSQMVMEAIGVKNWKTYSHGLNELIDFGFITMIEKSTNQYSSNIIAIVNFTKAHTKAESKALDKALSKHIPKQSPKQGQSIVSIDKQVTIEQVTNNNIPTSGFDFLDSLIKLGVDKQVATDWIKVRAKHKASNTQTAFNAIAREIKKSGLTPNACITKAVEKSWRGFESEWLKIQAPNEPQIKYQKLN
jgi:hypothetical protein